MQSLNCEINQKNKVGRSTADKNLLLVKFGLILWAINNVLMTTEEKQEIDCWLNENGC